MIITEEAKKLLEKKGKRNFLNLYKNSLDLLKGNGAFLEPVNTFRIYDFIVKAKERIEISAGVNIPNWNKDFDDIIRDTEVFIVTEEDIKNNPEIPNQSLPKAERRKEFLDRIHHIESELNDSNILICLFLIELINYIDYIGKTNQPKNSNIEGLIKSALQQIRNFGIDKDIRDILRKVTDLLRNMEEGRKNSGSNRLCIETLIRLLKTLTPEKDFNFRWSNGSEIEKLLQLADRVRSKLGEDRGDWLKKQLEEERRNLWDNYYYEDVDWLGCYLPDSQKIFLKLDKIYEEHEAFSSFGSYPMELMLQKVLLHELIHAALDFWPRDFSGKVITKSKKWKRNDCTEETLDNVLILQAYSLIPEEFPYIINFVSNQPYYYSKAIDLFKSRARILHFDYYLKSLIEYKVSAGETMTKKRDKGSEKKRTMILIPKWNGEKEGYIDEDGNWVIDPIFEKAFKFENGISMVMANGKFGWINTHGGWVIRPSFQSAFNFAEGLAAVKSYKWGFIDKEGKWVINPVFEEVGFFSEELAPATIEEDLDRWGYIDKKGKWIIQPDFFSAYEFFDGVAFVKDRETYLWGLINKEGKWVKEPTFDQVTSFDKDGYAHVRYSKDKLRTDGSYHWIIDTKGNTYRNKK